MNVEQRVDLLEVRRLTVLQPMDRTDQRIPFHPCSFSFGRRRSFWQRGDRRGRARSRESRCDLLLWFGEYYETG